MLPPRAVERTHHSSPLAAGIIPDTAVPVAPQGQEIPGIAFTEILLPGAVSEAPRIRNPLPEQEFPAGGQYAFHIVNQTQEGSCCLFECRHILGKICLEGLLLEYGCIICQYLAGNVHKVIAEAVRSLSRACTGYEEVPGVNQVRIVVMHIGIRRSARILRE